MVIPAAVMQKSTVLSAALAVLLFAAPALADGDRQAAESILAEVTQAKDVDVAAREIAEANKALTRARGAREGGDARSGERLEALARTWAESARDLLVATRAEAELADLSQKTADARAQAERERALLEETISRKGRAAVELSRVEAESAARPPAPPPKDKPRGKGGHGGAKHDGKKNDGKKNGGKKGQNK